MTYINQGRHVGTVGVTDPESLGGEVSFRTDDFIDYKIHTFTTSGTFEVTGTKPVLMDVMSIAGGGGGSGSGGGAGGMVDESFSIQPERGGRHCQISSVTKPQLSYDLLQW